MLLAISEKHGDSFRKSHVLNTAAPLLLLLLSLSFSLCWWKRGVACEREQRLIDHNRVSCMVLFDGLLEDWSSSAQLSHLVKFISEPCIVAAQEAAGTKQAPYW